MNQALSIQQLCARYNISRQTLYKRLKGLKIALTKQDNKSYISPEAVQELDNLNEFIKQGGSIAQYTPPLEGVVVNPSVSAGVDTANNSAIELAPSETKGMIELLERMVATLAVNLQPSEPNPLRIQELLHVAAENDYRLTTQQVKEILKRQSLPQSKVFESHGFKLEKRGFSGGRRLWKVEKISD